MSGDAVVGYPDTGDDGLHAMADGECRISQSHFTDCVKPGREQHVQLQNTVQHNLQLSCRHCLSQGMLQCCNAAMLLGM